MIAATVFIRKWPGPHLFVWALEQGRLLAPQKKALGASELLNGIL